MTTPRDPDRLIDAFLAEGPDRLPDRTYDTLRGDIDRTRQRVVIGPWREAHMNNLAKVAIALAAVVVVAIAGLNLMPGSSGPGTTAPSPTASQTPSATPSPTPTPSVAVDHLPPDGPLAPGTYQAVSEFDGVRFSFTVPVGWRSGVSFITNDLPDPTGLRLMFVPISNLYSDPCLGTVASPPVGPSVDDLVAGLMALPGTTGVTTQDVQVDGRDARLVEYTIGAEYTCAVDKFLLFRDEGGGDFYTWPPYGDVVRTWIVDVDGVRFVMTADIQASVIDANRAELQDVIDSIRFE
jgi:hypothetical protein